MSGSLLNRGMEAVDPDLNKEADSTKNSSESKESDSIINLKKKISDLRKEWNESVERQRENRGDFYTIAAINNSYSGKVSILEEELKKLQSTQSV